MSCLRHWSLAYRYLSLVVVLAGCATTQPSPPRDTNEATKQGKPYGLTVIPIPRVGMFNDLFWSSAEQYWNAILYQTTSEETTLLRAEGIGRPGLDWVPIFDVASLRNNAPVATATARTRLNSRQIAIRIRAPLPWTDCKLVIDADLPRNCGTAPNAAIRSTGVEHIYQFQIETNERRDFKVVLTGTFGRYELVGYVPADDLVVAMGDSFMSGEGNPDRPIRSGPTMNGDWKNVESELAWWKDRRCHRSMWAWPVRLALKMARRPIVDMGRGDIPTNELVVRRAISLISVACSGAEVGEGLISDWAGRESLGDILDLYGGVTASEPLFGSKLPLLDEDLNRFQQRRLKKQIFEVQELLSGYSRPIDLLLLSVGGNDINFAGIISEFLLTSERKVTSEKMKRKLEQDRKGLSEEYQRLAEELTASRLPEIRRTLIAQYPDPTWESDGKPCEGFFAVWTYSAKKMTFIQDNVVNPLNALIAEAARKNGWTALDIDQTPFHGHGWCTSGETVPYSADGTRWFRRLDEARNLQGTLPGNPIVSSGTLHPTHLAHLELARQVSDRLASQKLDFLVERADGTSEPLVSNSEPLATSRILRLQIIGKLLQPSTVLPDTSFATKSPEVRIGKGPWTECSGGPCVLENTEKGAVLHITPTNLPGGLGDGATKLEVRARSANLLRSYSEPLSVKIDLVKPVIEAVPQTWAREGREVTVYASDGASGSGVGSWRVVAKDGSVSSCVNSQPETTGVRASCVLGFDKEGDDVTIVAIDRAGNESDALKVAALIDSKPPTVDAVVISGVRFKPEGRKVAWLKNGYSQVKVLASDIGSGLARFEFTHPNGEPCGIDEPQQVGVKCIRIRHAAGPATQAPIIVVADHVQIPVVREIQDLEFIELPKQPSKQKSVSKWKKLILGAKDNQYLQIAQDARKRPLTLPAIDDDNEWVAISAWLSILTGSKTPSSLITQYEYCYDAARARLPTADEIPDTFYGLTLAIDGEAKRQSLVDLARCIMSP